MKRMEVMGKNKKSTVNQNTNDLTVYKVGAAFALLVLSLLALGRILNVYATGSTFDVVYRASQTVWTLCVILCAAGGAVSQIGDLAASAIKRNHNIKDYGHLIPGHGGILDRFDSVIFTAPIIYALTLLVFSR